MYPSNSGSERTFSSQSVSAFLNHPNTCITTDGPSPTPSPVATPAPAPVTTPAPITPVTPAPAPVVPCDCSVKNRTNGGQCNNYCGGDTCQWLGKSKTCVPL